MTWIGLAARERKGQSGIPGGILTRRESLIWKTEIALMAEHVDLALLYSGQLGAEIATLLLLATLFMIDCPRTERLVEQGTLA